MPPTKTCKRSSCLIGLLEEHSRNSTLGIEWCSQSFRDALNGKSWDKLTDEFSKNRTRRKRRGASSFRETQPIGHVAQAGAARKVVASRDGKPVKVSMRDSSCHGS